MALFARAQSGGSAAPDAPIVVTGQRYSSWLPFRDSATPLPRGPLTVADYGPPRAVAVGTAKTLTFFSFLNAANTIFDVATEVRKSATGEIAEVDFVDAPAAGDGNDGFAGDGSDATDAELSLSEDSLVKRSGIAVAEDGTLYIADTKNSTIRAVAGATSSEPGIIRSIAGKWAAAQNVQLAEPLGIAVDRGGNLYIADHALGTVSVLRQATGQLKVLAQVASPASLAVTRDGSKVFVASPETGGVFAIKTLDGSIGTVAGFAPSAGAAESAGPCAALQSGSSAALGTSAAPAVKASATGICPAGIAADGRGNLFVADANSGRILRVDAASGRMSTAVTGLIAPGDIAFDAQGDLFVSEQGRNRILAMAQIGDASGNLEVDTPAPPACPQGASFTYCNEPSGGTSASFQFTLKNLSGSAISQIAITPAFVPIGTTPPPAPTNFTTASTSCTATLNAGASCVINVAFTPLAAGSITGQLVVSDANPADTVTVNLAGTGDDFSLAIVGGNSPEVTVAQGGTATFKAQLNADAVFGQNGEKVTLACPNNMPAFTTCEFQPCPVTPTVGGATAFDILVHTSTKTTETPPIANPCNSTAAAARTRRADAPVGVLHITAGPPSGLGAARLPALAMALGALALIAFGRIAARTASAPRARRAFAALALAVFASGIVAACHKNSNAISTATPTGVTNMTITANAVDSGGNTLQASRGLQITLDVIQQTTKGPLP